MARKRLNKKVAVIGSLFLVVLGVVAVLVLWSWMGPRLFVNVDKALAEAEAAVRAEDYAAAEKAYGRALGRTKDNAGKVRILFAMSDMFIKANQWPKVLGAWKQIVTMDPRNVRARFGELSYYYVAADAGMRNAWSEVRDQAQRLIEIVETAGLMDADTEDYKQYELPGYEVKVKKLGVYLLLIAGRSSFELAQLGSAVDRDSALKEATEHLERAKSMAPDNVQVYWYLAEAARQQGELDASRGNVPARERAEAEAFKILQEGVQAAPRDPEAVINLLTAKVVVAKKAGREAVMALESEYAALLKTFSDSGQAHAAAAAFYSDPRLGPKSVDRAVSHAEEAVKLDPASITYAMNKANIYYRRYCLQGDAADLKRCIETAERALQLPEAQLQEGPLRWPSRQYRTALSEILARCHLGELLDRGDTLSAAEKQTLLTKADAAVREIEQIILTAQEPRVMKWQGLVELARGNEDAAVRKLYAAYEQWKAADMRDSLLSYTLAQVFKGSSETGAVQEFLTVALQSGITWTKVDATLDYAEVLINLRAWNYALAALNEYDSFFGKSPRSQRLRTQAYIGAFQFDEAAKQLDELPAGDADTMKLQLELVQAKIHQVRTSIAQQQLLTQGQSPDLVGITEIPDDAGGPLGEMNEELKTLRLQEAAIVAQLVKSHPDRVDDTSLRNACRTYISQNNAAAASAVVSAYLQHHPSSTTALMYTLILAEPAIAQITANRQKAFQEQAIRSLPDATQRSLELGLFYYGENDMEKAAEAFKAALRLGSPGAAPPRGSDEYVAQQTAAGYLFEMAIKDEDWTLAGRIAEAAKLRNLDESNGLFYAARLAAARGENQDALVKANECIALRPVNSMAYMLRSTIRAAMGADHAAVEDITRARVLNPTNGAIARTLASTLYERDRKLGDNVTQEQRMETRQALERAIQLNPRNWRLLSFYAEYISDSAPDKAISIRQSLLKAQPTLENAVLLGNLATRQALTKVNAAEKETLFKIAEDAFEQGLKINPVDRTLLYRYGEHWRSRGRPDLAESVIRRAKDDMILAVHFYELGQYEDAERLLKALEATSPNDKAVIDMLLKVAERTNNTKQVESYSQKLIDLDSGQATMFKQLESYLRSGLIQQAEEKLAAFKERYPNDKKVLLLESWLSMRKGDLLAALDLVNKHLEDNQDNAAAWRLRGEIHLLLSNHDQAILDLRQSNSLSDSADTRVSLAKAYLRAGRDQDAITELKNTIDKPGAPVEARTLLERTYSRLGRTGEQWQFYQDTLAKFPNSVIWLTRAGTFAISRGALTQAEELFRRAYNLKKQTYTDSGTDLKQAAGDMLFARALDGYLQTLVLRAGTPDATDGTWRPEKLDEVFSEAGQYLGTPMAPVAYFRMAEARYKLGDMAKATEFCQKAVEQAGDNETLASEILLRMFLLLGDEEVTRYCEQMLKATPKSVAALFTLFNLSKINSEYDRAIQYIDKCIALSSDDERQLVQFTMKKAEALTLAYELLSDKKYLLQAVTDYQSLADKMPTNNMVLNNLAYMLAESDQRLSDALKYAERALQAMPNDPGYLDTYAYVLYKNGDYAKAAQYMTRALQQYEQDGAEAPADVYMHLGLIQEKLGDKTQALTAYQQAKKAAGGRVSEAAAKRIEEAIARVSK
ncbi:MAG TPA: tetratricopeptide repeat protein [Phycisphaerales bacterium]|nr:tetratricopeptide repeat protein [Phycisphaerales bacterium]